MRIPIRWLSLAIAVVFLVGLAADADAKRKKQATVEQPVTPPAAPETPPEESKTAAPAEPLPAPATEAAVVKGAEDGGAGEPGPETPPAPAADDTAVNPAAAESETSATVDDVEIIEATEAGNVPDGEAATIVETDANAGDGSRAELYPITGGVELAVAFPDPLANLGSGFSIAAEVGYLLSSWDQRLELLVDFVYVGSQRINKDILDPRVPDGVYRYSIIEREFQFHIGALARLYPPGEFLNFYGQLGVGAHFQLAEARGKAGPPGMTGTGFLPNQDNSAAFSVYVAPGVELMLGPGAITAELGVDFSHLNQTVAGGVGAVRFGLRLGYHILWGRDASRDTATDAVVDVPDEEARVAGAEILIKNSLLFLEGSADLDPRSQRTLAAVADLLKRDTSIKHLAVRGHTDNIGTPEDNLDLSKARAETVVAVLVGFGIAPDRLMAEGYGDAHPLAGNDTDKGRRLNRRVEFKILE